MSVSAKIKSSMLMLSFPAHNFLSAKLHCIILWIAKNERKSDRNLYHPSHITISVSTLQNIEHNINFNAIIGTSLVVHGTILPIYLLLAICCIVVHVRLWLGCSWAPQFILSSLPNNLNVNKRIIGSIGTSFWSRGGDGVKRPPFKKTTPTKRPPIQKDHQFFI